jgi:hypothetical protein
MTSYCRAIQPPTVQGPHPIVLLVVFLLRLLPLHSVATETHQQVDDAMVLDMEGNIDAATTRSSVDTNRSSNSNMQHTPQFSSADLQCRIWLAPSTLKGAGLGMFAGTDYEPNEELLVGGDITVAITDLIQHNVAPGQTQYGTFLWDEYTWNAAGLKMDSEGYETNVASEGFGSAANSFLPVYNVEEWHPRIVYTGLHRSRDPGVGASTMFHHRLSTAKRHISAGEELYVSCTYFCCCCC